MHYKNDTTFTYKKNHSPDSGILYPERFILYLNSEISDLGKAKTINHR
jgi:hypothetical protein